MNKEEIVQKPLKKIISWLDSFFNDDTTYYAASLSFLQFSPFYRLLLWSFR